MIATPRLTDLAHGGGCGCKLAPSVLSQILAKMPAREFKHLLVGTETADDAAVFQINDRQAIVATTDFFMPIVDDPFDFGRIAATNALSDVYAMGGTPFLALAIVGMPVGKLPVDMVQEILAGGASVCATAGIPVAGGHSIDSPEPIYGLVALGLVDPARVIRNSTAQAGDQLILTKRLGVGIYSAALKRQQLDEASYREMIASTTQLNAVGADLAGMAGVHAVTDVTGFGLLGHAWEVADRSGARVELDAEALPLYPGALEAAEAGVRTGGDARNRAHLEGRVFSTAPAALEALAYDPQTSGGLLAAVAPEQAAALEGWGHCVGRVVGGAPGVDLR